MRSNDKNLSSEVPSSPIFVFSGLASSEEVKSIPSSRRVEPQSDTLNSWENVKKNKYETLTSIDDYSHLAASKQVKEHMDR